MTSTHAGDSPVLHSVLRDRVLSEIRATMAILSEGDGRSVRSVAESHLPAFAAVTVGVLAEHEPDSEGNCSACSRPGRWWRRRVHAPCKVLLSVNLALSNPMHVLTPHLAELDRVPVPVAG